MNKNHTSKYDNFFKKGQKIGQYTIVSGEIVFLNYYASVEVVCDCGNKKYVDAYGLSQGRSNRCSSCNKHYGTSHGMWKGHEEIPGTYFFRLFRGAKERNIEFSITIEDVWSVFVAQRKKCSLTNLEVSFKNRTASLDRIDSNLGYTKENIQIVHKDINRMKNAFDQQYFLEMCKLVAENNK